MNAMRASLAFPFVNLRGLGLILMLGLTACSCGESDDGSGGGASTPGATAAGAGDSEPAVERRPVDPATAGSISGRVRVAGGATEPEQVLMSEAWCRQQHDGGSYLDNRVVADPDGGLANVFVWVKRGVEDYAFPEPTGGVVVDQVGCLYTPRVQGATAGQPIEVRNSDDTMHNVRVPAAGVNRAMPPGADPFDIRIRRPPEMVEFKCDVHAWMKGWVCVVPHPLWAVSGADGAFRIEGVPPGTHTLEIWHETLGTTTRDVVVGESQDLVLEAVVLGG